MTKSRLIFDHLPKTAGTSIAAALGRMFGESPRLPEFFNVHFQVIRSAGRRRVLAGHLWFTPNEPLAPGWYYCTLLRDPIDRFLSQYWFYRTVGRQFAQGSGQEAHEDPQVRAAAELELDDYLAAEDTRIQRSFRNVQALHFAQRVCTDPDGLSEKELLDAATTSLEQYDLVGTFDDTQGFIDAIARDFALDRVELPRLNTTQERKRHAETPGPLIACLERENRVDTQLRAWARRRFCERDRQPKIEPSSAMPTSSDGTTTAPSTGGLDFGTHEVEIRSIRCFGDHSGGSKIFSGESVNVVIEFAAASAVEDLTIGLAVRDQHGQLVYGINTRLLKLKLPIPQAGIFRSRLVLQVSLGLGRYGVTIALHKGSSHAEGCYHWMENATAFTVVGKRNSEFEGLVDLGLKLRPALPEYLGPR